MKINLLELENFRNYSYFRYEPSDGINLIVGKNAVGKTNLLESIHLISTGRSFRSQKTSELIKFKEGYSRLRAELEEGGYKDELEIRLSSLKNEYLLNSSPMSMKSYSGDFACVVFSPFDLNMVKLSPGERRKYIDNLIEKISPLYKANLSKYKRILYERNKLLKRVDEELLKIYDFQLSNYGVKILFERLKVLREIEKFANSHYMKLSGGQELKITYLSTVKLERDNMEEVFMKTLFEEREKDLKNNTTTIGPHRDDLDFKINDVSAKSFASQGETRSVVLSLKLAELDVIEKFNKKKAILLLDDVFSELDSTRVKYLSHSLENMQTFITSTNAEEDFLKDIDVKRLYCSEQEK